MGRILGIDYGKRRSGLAVTDVLKLSINPLPTQKTESLYDFISEYLNDNDVETIVIGYPTHADGSPTRLANDIVLFCKKLRSVKRDLTVHFIDESYSSVEARNILIQMGVKKKARRKKENIDRSSAVLILKSFLDRKFDI